MSEHHAVRLGRICDDSICSLLTSCWAILLVCLWTRSTLDRRTAAWDILQPVQYPPPPSHSKTNNVSGTERDSILHNQSPFDKHHFLLSQPTTIRKCAVSDACLEFGSLHLNCKASRIRPSLNALCDVLAENTRGPVG